MRPLLLLPALLLPLFAVAQQPPVQTPPPQGSNWQHVQALPAGASIQIKARTTSLSCKLVTVAEDSLTCNHSKKDVTLQRAEIKTITIPRRGRSALIGTGIGGGAGALIGFGVGTSGPSWFGNNAFRGPVTAVFAALGGVVGAGVGAATDFAYSTVYRAP
jgi:hypothetical protein